MAGFAAVVELATLDGTEGFQLNGEGGGDLAGFSVSSAGDINGDGYDDFIVGAKYADTSGVNNTGAAYLVFGSAGGFPANLELSSLDGTNGFRLSGAVFWDLAGASVSAAGDVNGDGYDDFIVGAYQFDYVGGAAGASYVVFGKASGFAANLNLSSIDGTNGFRLTGKTGAQFSGWSVASAGDVNGDGYDDVIIGALTGNNAAVVFGKASGFAASTSLRGLDGSNGFQISGPSGAKFAFTVHSAGDINGDGYDDVIIGAYNSGAGAAYVVFGRASGFAANIDVTSLDGTNGFKLNGVQLDDQFGFSVSGGGDINGDGIDDLVVGARNAYDGSSYSGAAYVLFGKTSGFAATLNVSSLDGSNGFEISNSGGGSSLGSSVSLADVNGDGYQDVVVGSLDSNPNGSNAGVSYVVFGKGTAFASSVDVSSLNGTTGFAIRGEATGDLARTVGNAGDINGDGADDLIIGAINADPNGGNSGAAYVVLGKASALTWTGGSGDDTQTGTGGADTLSGGDGNDTLHGAAGADSLDGGIGNDIIDGGTGADAMTGGTGNDTYYVDDAGDTTVENSGEGYDTVHSTLSWTLSANTEQLVLDGTADIDGTGNALNNNIVGNSGANVLDGADGVDVIHAGDGADTVTGGNGADQLYGEAGDDSLGGGAGDDLLDGGAGADAMAGGAGDDAYIVDDAGDTVTEASGEGNDVVKASVSFTLGANLESLILTGSGYIDGAGNALNNNIVGNSGANTLSGGDGADVIKGGDGNDTVYGGDGADTILGETGYDVLNGGEGNDNIDGGTLGDTLHGDNGNDILHGGTGFDTLYGDAGGDQLYGDNGNDSLNGGDGNDRLDGGLGGDAMTGGAGDDIYYVDDANDTVTEASGEGTDTVRATVSYAMPDNVENLQLMAGGALAGIGNGLNNAIVGSSGDNRLLGGDGADMLTGAEGNDYLDGGTGQDIMVGGTGDDVYIVDNAADTVIENGGEGTDVVKTSVSWTLGVNFETLALTGSANINGVGNDGGNLMVGNSGNNTLSGAGGNDLIKAGGGDDTVYGGDGADQILGEAGDDVLSGGEGADVIDGGADGDTLHGDNGNDSLSGGTGSDQLFGDAGADALDGGSGNDFLFGGEGNDRLDGGTGADFMFGGAGDDIYYVDDAGDFATEAPNEGTDTVRATVSFSLGGEVENLQLLGTADIAGSGNGLSNTLTGNSGANVLSGGGGADVIKAGDGADTLYGGSGADTLLGQNGDDFIIGGSGNDTMTGGAGADTFVILDESVIAWSSDGPGPFEIDTILDLDKAQGDKLDLSGIDADIHTDGDQAFTLVGAFGRHAGEMTLTFNAGSNTTMLALDVDGDGRADYQMRITGDVRADSGGWLL
jgi:Ca2+-binding RTX toxin-like protein